VRALEYFSPDPTPVPAEIAAYLAERRRTDTAPATLYAYGRALMDFAAYVEDSGGRPFSASLCTVQTILDYKSYLRIRRLSAATVNRHLAALRGFFGYAVACGWITADPTATVHSARLVPGAPKSLDGDQKARLLAVMRTASPRDRALVAVLLHGGLRVGEATNLRTRDVILGASTGEIRVRSGKGDKDRAVPTNSALHTALAAYLVVRPVGQTDHLFLGQDRTGIEQRWVRVLVGRYGERAQIEGLTPHILRHTFARDLLAAGIDIMTVAHLLGHQNVATTMTYTRPSQGDLRAAVERLVRGADGR
jgi:site-specific recombinase XerD